MDFFLRNLKETLEAINKLIDNNVYVVNTKRVRRCNNIKSSNRSKINFIWRSLKFLAEQELLEKNGVNSPVTYKIRPKDKIDVENFLKKMDEFRNRK